MTVIINSEDHRVIIYSSEEIICLWWFCYNVSSAWVENKLPAFALVAKLVVVVMMVVVLLIIVGLVVLVTNTTIEC